MKIQPQQIKLLYSLLKSTGMMEQKEALVHAFGNCKSSKDLTYAQAGELISHLKTLEPGHKMRRKIIKMAHEMGWQLAGKKIDLERLNGWCKQFGFGKKPLNDYTAKELPKLVTQFQNGPYKHYLQSV